MESLETSGLPLEIALLPLVESAFDPFAYSHGRASGLWQFIPGTARLQGLKIDWWFDGRRDVVYSTEAAIDYLSMLNRQFKGDWELTLAAYNGGIGNVRKSIRRRGNHGNAADFWTLDLAKETEAYVPKLLAIAALVANPGAFNYELQASPTSPFSMKWTLAIKSTWHWPRNSPRWTLKHCTASIQDSTSGQLIQMVLIGLSYP